MKKSFYLILLPLLLAPPAAAQPGESHRFEYDPAGNLLSRTTVEDGVTTRVDLPLDGSGRNRPASVAGIPLEWDGNGNLVRKGDLRFRYDYRNRLSAVTDLHGQVLVNYTYDAFNRRVRQAVAGEVHETVWQDWRPVETYVDGKLRTRRVYGRELDEIVRLERDGDGDGVLEQSYVPLYDEGGNLAVVTDGAGKPVEVYGYTPHGRRRIFVDATPPKVEQVRVVEGQLWLEISEQIDGLDALPQALFSDALRLENRATGALIPFATSGLKPHARRHRLSSRPEVPPAAGTEVVLEVPAGALVDDFFNPAPGFALGFAWPAGDAVVHDPARPEVFEVGFRDGALEIEFSEEVAPAAVAAAVALDGAATSWTLLESRYRLRAAKPLPAGRHRLAIAPGLADLGGQELKTAFEIEFELVPELPEQLVFRAPDPRQTAASALANEFGFHGLPQDPVTGFLYVRNRYYDPDLGRFITPDPLGFVDGPNPYAFAGNDPVNKTDPLGLACPECTNPDDPFNVKARARREEEARRQALAALVEERDIALALILSDLNAQGFPLQNLTPEVFRQHALKHFAQGRSLLGASQELLRLFGPGACPPTEPLCSFRGSSQHMAFLERPLELALLSTLPELAGGRLASEGLLIGRGGSALTAPEIAALARTGRFSAEELAALVSGRGLGAGAGGVPRALGRGSTADLAKGTTLPRNLREQLAIEQVMANPAAGRQLPLTMSDPRWPASEGWVKMQQIIQSSSHGAPINVHYVLNQITGAADDFKIILTGPR